MRALGAVANGDVPVAVFGVFRTGLGKQTLTG